MAIYNLDDNEKIDTFKVNRNYFNHELKIWDIPPNIKKRLLSKSFKWDSRKELEELFIEILKIWNNELILNEVLLGILDSQLQTFLQIVFNKIASEKQD